MTHLIVTVDIDWACEAAIEETLQFLDDNQALPTIFTTHHSPIVELALSTMDVGLHPYFASDSSHGSTIEEVVATVMNLPHNLPAFRCHRFAVSNESRLAMAEAGMVISSNVCTDLEQVLPFKDRFGLLEIPIFMEDGGYLWRRHPLELNPQLMALLCEPIPKVLLIHPMHIALNTPDFEYMKAIKASLSRSEWNNLNISSLKQMRWKGRGIRDLFRDIFQTCRKRSSIRSHLEMIGGNVNA